MNSFYLFQYAISEEKVEKFGSLRFFASLTEISLKNILLGTLSSHNNNMTLKIMVNYFISELDNNRVIICNGIVEEFTNPKVYNFIVFGSTKPYKWKEAGHSYVIIGYDKSKRVFIVADNYGYLLRPYHPLYRIIKWKKVYEEIKLINKNRLDYSFSLGK